MPDSESIYLVDGSSYIYRAYHAIKDLTNSKGFPTNAIFGVMKMLLKLLKDKSPQHVLVVFDAKGSNFRHEIYPQYKANRPPIPESLAVQVPIIKELVSALGIPTLEQEGYEADDLIGTFCRYLQEKEFNVIIVSGDKDLKQLLAPKVSMWDPMRDTYTTWKDLKAQTGLEPRQLVDVMALSGDPVDNIPGVPSVGEKTALKLIQEHGSLEKVYEALGEMRGKLREKLANYKEQAFLSRELVRIKEDVPLALEIPTLKERNQENLLRLLRELEFTTLWKDFAKEEPITAQYHVLTDRDDLIRLRDLILDKGVFAFDIETTSEDPISAEIVGVSMCTEPSLAYYIPIGHRDGSRNVELDTFKSIFGEIYEDSNIRKIGHNIKYDVEVLFQHGINVKGIYFDTMVASYLVNPEHRQHNLAFLSQHYLNSKKILYEEVVGKGKEQKSISQIPAEVVAKYCCEDSDFSLRLKDILYAELKQYNNLELMFDIEVPLIEVLIEMELNGIKIDSILFRDLSHQFEVRLSNLTEEIYKEAGMEFNINSPQQLSFVLFEKLKLPGLKKTSKTKAFSTNVKVLKQLASGAHRLPELLLEYRTLMKLKSTYLDSLVNLVNPKTGRVHTSFNQAVTATGRLSSSNPNLQNIPVRGETGREIRKGFIAEEGHVFLSADYSQIELRIFAHYSGDSGFIEAFNSGEDVHSKTAMEILGVKDPSQVTPDMRRIAKAINFGIIYGMGAQKLSEELGIDLKLAKSYIERYYERYPGVLDYRKRMIEKAQKDGYVTTLFNRRRYLPNIKSDNKGLQSEAERAAINTPIQGTAADLIKKAMILVRHRLKRESLNAKMLLQVHDELLFEVPEEELSSTIDVVKEEMEGVYQLSIPLKVDIGIGKNWDEAHA